MNGGEKFNRKKREMKVKRRVKRGNNRVRDKMNNEEEEGRYQKGSKGKNGRIKNKEIFSRKENEDVI